jgi:hypothetical protein
MHACTPLQVPSGTGVPPFAEQSSVCCAPLMHGPVQCMQNSSCHVLAARPQSHTHEGPARQQPASYCLYAAKSTGRYEPAGRPRLGCGTMQQAQEPKPQLTHTACRDALCRCTWYHPPLCLFFIIRLRFHTSHVKTRPRFQIALSSGAPCSNKM